MVLFLSFGSTVQGCGFWFLKDFHRSGTFERSLNATFLALVPKKGGVEDIKDCRHIRWMVCKTLGQKF